MSKCKSNCEYSYSRLPDEILDEIDFNKDLAIVYVTGGFYNPYGHSILKLGDKGYIHINTLHSYPQYFDKSQFKAYLAKEGGEQKAEHILNIRNPENAKSELKKLANKDWLWELAHHNCLTFIHQIAFAGGVTAWELGYPHDDDKQIDPKLPLNFEKLQTDREKNVLIPEASINELKAKQKKHHLSHFVDDVISLMDVGRYTFFHFKNKFYKKLHKNYNVLASSPTPKLALTATRR